MIKRILAVCIVLLIGSACVSIKGRFDDPGEPASRGEYDIQSISNDMGLVKIHAKELSSGCGLSGNDFIKYAHDRIDHSRSFQFIVFVSGKPLVGRKCYRKAFIFYLKKGDTE